MTLPAGFDDWFARCVDRNPARRFPDASVAMESLRRAGQCGHALAAMELQALGLA